MIANLLAHVNNYPVIAQIEDFNSETAQSVVVCDRGADRQHDRYAVWTVAVISGETTAWNGRYYTGRYPALFSATVRAGLRDAEAS